MGNTFSFDDSEFSESAASSEDAADEALASIEESPEPLSEEDEELADVDLRLETADYYRAILKHEFFETNRPAAKIVDREIRSFIRERLEILLGLRSARQAEVVSPFEDDEIQALKLLAGKVLKKPGLVSEPQVLAVKKMAAPVPAPRPEAKVVIAKKPQVKKIPAPAPAPSTKPKAQKAIQRPKIPTPVAKPQKKSAAPSQAATPKVVDREFEGGESQTFIDHQGKEVTLVEGEVVEEQGRRFRVARNANGTLFRKDITGQVVPPNRLPPMSEQQISIMSQQMAERQLGMLDETTGMAIVASLQRE